MLAIRLQRRGRKGHAQFRMIVQDAKLSPKSGRVVAHLGSYDPHSKVATLDTEKAEFYLSNGAQPSNSAAKILDREKVKLPEWVEITRTQERSIRDAEKLRKNQPAEEAPAEEAAPSDDVPSEEPADETPAEEAPEEAAEETPAEEEKAE